MNTFDLKKTILRNVHYSGNLNTMCCLVQYTFGLSKFMKLSLTIVIAQVVNNLGLLEGDLNYEGLHYRGDLNCERAALHMWP